jgi:tRNA pseudouridine38-40 synthase
VQDEVERALETALAGRGGSPALTVAGRTDAGVHAWGQVASYDGPPVPVGQLNGLLADDVSVLSCVAAPSGFDARRDATSRAYCYRVLVRPARSALERERMLHWPYPVDLDALDRCTDALLGLHDFTAFTPTETDHVRFSREVYLTFWRMSPVGLPVLEFWIEADSFMRHMNRVLVGTMLEVAGGRRSDAEFRALLTGRPRAEAGPTAPPHGLYLAAVGYQGRRVLAA